MTSQCLAQCGIVQTSSGFHASDQNPVFARFHNQGNSENKGGRADSYLLLNIVECSNVSTIQ
jgi:hypothetical protein